MPLGRRRPYPFEIAALAFAASVAAVLLASGLPVRGSVPRFATLALVLLVGGALLGVGLQCAARWLTRRDPRAYLEALREPGWWTLWVRLWLACMLASASYFWLKAYVPRLNPARFDEALWRIDRTIHLGVAPVGLSRSLLPDAFVRVVLDPWYGLWLLTLFAGIAFLAASRRPGVRRGAMLSCIALWAFGALGYALLPVVGPAFAFPGLFRELAQEMPIAAATQQQLFAHYEQVAAGGAVRDYTRGVAALPSLHVGFHVLFALWVRRIAPRLLPLLVAAVLLTFVGSLRSGWHYALDGYAGAACAAAAYWLGVRLEGSFRE